MAEKSQNKEQVVAKTVRAVLASKRHENAKTKKRGEVSGGGKKPFRQKGTGRARAGSSRSPIWRGGGITFGPTGNQNFSISVNKKEKKAALDAAFGTKKEATIEIAAPKMRKTKEAAALLAKNDAKGKVLVLISEKSEKGVKESENLKNLKMVFKNIKDTKVIRHEEANAYDVLWADKIILIQNAKIKSQNDNSNSDNEKVKANSK